METIGTCGPFAEHDRIFMMITDDTGLPGYINKKFVLFSCIGTQDGKPIYRLYSVDVITAKTGRYSTDVTHHNMPASGPERASGGLLGYYEENAVELDRSFTDVFAMMYNGAQIIDDMKEAIACRASDTAIRKYRVGK